MPDFGPIGEIIYLRTYSRYLPDLLRRENWEETVDRVVRFSVGLAPTEEWEESSLRQVLLDLKGFTAGRTLWIGGTPYAQEDNGQAQFNCAFMDVEEPKDFHDMVFLLMSGVGVGFRVTRDNVEKLNNTLPIKQVAEVVVKPYNFYGYDHHSYSHGTAIFYTPFDSEMHIVVGDSREGWAEAVQAFLKGVTSYRRVVIDVNRVRPMGERLKTFGGYASGPEPLIEFFLTVPKILEREPYGQWSSTKILDIMNLIGRMVVAGGTRRSAQIALGDADDLDFVEAKTGDWWNKYPWRTQSNNTVIFHSKPDRETLKSLMEKILQYGEPGLLNAEAASRRRPNFRGINPCAEILLDNNGFCNLVTVVLPRHVKDGRLDMQDLEHTIRVLTRHAIRITTVKFPIHLKEWAEVQYRDRLLGVSFTGYGDLVDMLELSEEEQKELLSWMRRVVHEEAQTYSAKLGINPPLLATTVKPEGTLSLLPGVSSGVHPSYAPYYIRRVRISKMDAVAQALRDLGLEPKPEVGFNSLEEAHTWVFEFPIKTPAKKALHEYSAVEQLERYKLVNSYYADHNTSITVYIRPDEVDQVVDWLLENWDHYVAVSFLPKSNEVYPLMPFEQITKKRYEKMVAKMPDLSLLKLKLDMLEQLGAMVSDDLDPSCDTGVCPTR